MFSFLTKKNKESRTKALNKKRSDPSKSLTRYLVEHALDDLDTRRNPKRFSYNNLKK